MKRVSVVLLLLLTAGLFKSLVWTTLVPLWHTPDEQAHFAQLEFMAENHVDAVSSPNNLSKEIAVSEELLGTRRNDMGNNQFTYHPEYKIEYTNSFLGKYENLINNQPKSSRTSYVGYEAADYPPLYYQLSLPFYYATYSNGLIDRVFASRLLPIILGLLLAVTAYFIGKTIFEDKILAIVLAGLVSFQPMISFVAAGIHPDNLLNLLYSLAIFVCLLILKKGLKAKYVIVLLLLIFLGLQTKILMIFFLPVAGAVVIYKFLHESKLGIILAVLCLISPVVAFIFRLPLPYMPGVTASSPLVGMDFWEYLKFRGPKLAFEIWPWYWGVFKWLGVTLPPLVMKIITRTAILAGIGLVVYFFQVLQQKKFDFKFKAVIFFFLSSLFYLLYLIFWDWRLMQSIGFSQGLQGRYFFTNIVPQMFLLLFGVISLLPKKLARWRGFAAGLFLAGMILLNIMALYRVCASYYDLSSWQTFLVQASQYKPEIIKQIL